MWRVMGVLVFTAFVGSACSDLFDVENPTDLGAEDLDDENLTEALGNSAQGRLSQGYSDMMVGAATASDEAFFISSYTYTRELQAGVMTGFNQDYDQFYDNMAASRWVADEMIGRLQGIVASPDSDIALANSHFWAGYARVLLADFFEDVPIDGSPPLSPAAALEQAILSLDRAAQIAAAAGDMNLRGAALGSKARALRGLYFERGMQGSDFAAALQAAEQALAAAPDYWLDIGYQMPGSENIVYVELGAGIVENFIDPRYANLIDPVGGGVDPRIKHTVDFFNISDQRLDTCRTLFAAGDLCPGYTQLKYPDRSADIPVSRWQEARLIAAEAHLVAGNLPGAVEQINFARAGAGLPAFSSSDADEILAQLKYERIAEFWLEGRRLQDMRYYGQIPPDWGDPQKLAGSNRRWPVSVQEQNTNEFYR
jgi:hypothetical protein